FCSKYMDIGEALLSTFSKNANQIDDVIRAYNGPIYRPAMADIRLHHLNLADFPQGLHIISDFRPAHGNAYSIATFGERGHNRASDKARAAENSDQFWPVMNFIRFGLHSQLLNQCGSRPEIVTRTLFSEVDLMLFARKAKRLVVTIQFNTAFQP